MTAARARRLWTAACLLATLSCDGPGVASPRNGVVLGGGTAASALSVVGTWRRLVVFVDDFGFARSSETTWQFGADGAVARVLVTRNLSLGLIDVLVSAGRYRLSNDQVIVDLVTPSPVQLQLSLRLVGEQLELAGQTYLRVSG